MSLQPPAACRLPPAACRLPPAAWAYAIRPYKPLFLPHQQTLQEARSDQEHGKRNEPAQREQDNTGDEGQVGLSRPQGHGRDQQAADDSGQE